MGDIIESEEIDKDTVTPEELRQQFSHCQLLTEISVSVDKSYITKICGTESLRIAVGLSDNSIEVYEIGPTSLTQVCRFSGHRKVISDVVFSPIDDNLVLSSGHDGLLKLWDTRASDTCALEYKDVEDNLMKPFECFDISSTGRVLCAGSQLIKNDAFIVFWDQRQPKPIGGYWNSHTDDITQVRFHPNRSEILATGSLDGLLNIFNIMKSTEEDALTYSLNMEDAVERVRWLDIRRVAAATTAHAARLWDFESGDLLRSYDREKVAKGIRRSKVDDCYVVDFLAMPRVPGGGSDGPARLLAGSYAGDGTCLRSVEMGDKKLKPKSNFAANKQTVTCCWYQPHKDILVTGGEAGLVSVWGASGGKAQAAADAVAGPSGGGASGEGSLSATMGKLKVHRHRPY